MSDTRRLVMRVRKHITYDLSLVVNLPTDVIETVDVGMGRMAIQTKDVFKFGPKPDEMECLLWNGGTMCQLPFTEDRIAVVDYEDCRLEEPTADDLMHRYSINISKGDLVNIESKRGL